jgi:hypothetical protein
MYTHACAACGATAVNSMIIMAAQCFISVPLQRFPGNMGLSKGGECAS